MVDEAGEVDDLEKVYKNVLLATGLTEGATTVFSSTPSETPDHDSRRIYEQCEAEGCAVRFTIDDNTFLSPDLKNIYIEELGGRETTACRRELYVEFVTEEERERTVVKR